MTIKHSASNITVVLRKLAPYAGSPLCSLALCEFDPAGKQPGKSEIYHLNMFYLWDAEFIHNVRNRDMDGLLTVQDGDVTLKKLYEIVMRRLRDARLWISADDYVSLLTVLRTIEPDLSGFNIVDFDTFCACHASLPFTSRSEHLIHVVRERVLYIQEIHELLWKGFNE